MLLIALPPSFQWGRPGWTMECTRLEMPRSSSWSCFQPILHIESGIQPLPRVENQRSSNEVDYPASLPKRWFTLQDNLSASIFSNVICVYENWQHNLKFNLPGSIRDTKSAAVAFRSRQIWTWPGWRLLLSATTCQRSSRSLWVVCWA